MEKNNKNSTHEFLGSQKEENRWFGLWIEHPAIVYSNPKRSLARM